MRVPITVHSSRYRPHDIIVHMKFYVMVIYIMFYFFESYFLFKLIPLKLLLRLSNVATNIGSQLPYNFFYLAVVYILIMRWTILPNMNCTIRKHDLILLFA